MVCHRSRRLRILLLAAIVAGVAVSIWIVGLVQFAATIPRGVEDDRSASDAIVVLTGGSERLTTGLDLLSSGRARWMFVSGVHPGVDREAIVRGLGGATDALVARVETGHLARNTAGNARETAAWMRQHAFTSLRLVTASYHMPRSLLELRRVLPEATIIPHPVFPAHVKQARWWAWPGTAMLIIGEYHKYLWSVARLRMTSLLGSEPEHQ